MSEKLLDILKPSSACITQDVLLGYAERKLSPAETRRVEEHLTECELCSDALDGIMKSGDVTRYRSQVYSLKKILRHKVHDAEHKMTFPFTRVLAVAATVLLLALCGWFVQYLMYNESQKIFSDQFEPYPAPATDSVIQPLSPAVTEFSDQKVTEKSSPEKAVKSLSKEGEYKSTDNPKQDADAAGEAEYDKSRSTQAVTIPGEESVVGDVVGDTARVSDDSKMKDVSVEAKSESEALNTISQKKVTTQKNANAPATVDVVSGLSTFGNNNAGYTDVHLSNGLKLYNEEKYSEALVEFDSVLTIDRLNSTANFYSGVSSLANDEPDGALEFFGKTDNRNSEYYEATLWYQALAHLKKENKKEAKNLLEKIVKLNGEYKERAQGLLNEL